MARRTTRGDEVDDLDESSEVGADDDGDAVRSTSSAAGRDRGPWDVEDAPEDGLDRLDLGGMLVPVGEGMELRVDVSPEGQVIAATVVKGNSAMQVNAFAAPRTAGIWAEIADEILESLVEGGGSGESLTGPSASSCGPGAQEVPGEGALSRRPVPRR